MSGAETTVPPIPADPWHGHPLREEVERLRERLHSLRKLVDAQAEDEGLWGVYPFGEQPVVEAYLQQELRRLHAAVEACWPEGEEKR